MIRHRRRAPARFSLVALLALAAGCGDIAEPRYAEVTISADAPSATLSGSTRAAAPAIELSPGCPGYLDPSAPEHVVHLRDATAVTITARSSRGPLALAVAGEGEVRCDSDGGAGHAPRVTIDQPGDYAVHVASLHQAEDLAYELVVAPAGLAPVNAPPMAQGERQALSVTITSDPPGASVRTPEGEVLGTTPTMFVVYVGPSELGSERRFVLELPGRPSTEVSGRLLGGAMVLHAAIPGGLAPALVAMGAPGSASVQGPELVATASSAQPIRDYQVARQAVEVSAECTIASASVEVDIRHSFIGDLRVLLRSPSGTEVRLHDHGGGGRANLVTQFDWNARRGALQRLAGESARGRWTMSVHDDAGADTGTFRSFTLRLACRESGGVETAGASRAAAPPPPQNPPSAPRPRARTTAPPPITRHPGHRPPLTTPPPRPPVVHEPWRRPPVTTPPPPPQPWQAPPPGSRSNG